MPLKRIVLLSVKFLINLMRHNNVMNINHILQNARVLFDLRQYAKAEKLFRGALAVDPNNGDIYYYLSVCKTKMGSHDEAFKLMIEARRLEPTNDLYLYGLSRLYLILGKPQQAREQIHKAIEISPTIARYFFIAATIEFSQRDYVKASEYADQGLSHDPSHIQLLVLKSQVLKSQGNFEDAQAMLKNALSFNPEMIYAHVVLGMRALEAGDWLEASIEFETVLSIEPHHDVGRKGLLEVRKEQWGINRWYMQYSRWRDRNGKLFFYLSVFFVLCSLALMVNGFFYPFMGASMLLMESWIIVPVLNLYVLFKPRLRHLLSSDELWISKIVAGCIIISGICLIVFAFNISFWLFTLFYVSFTMISPVGALKRPSFQKQRNDLLEFAIIILVMGLSIVVLLLLDISYVKYGLLVYVWAIISYQAIAAHYITEWNDQVINNVSK